MDIKIKKLTLDNFKGIKSLLVVFGDITNIFGDNATGKTTINDAFRWLLFDKDSDDRKDFDIKTIDPKTDEAIHGLNHVVRGVLVVDGVERAFEKTYKEKWVKKQGGTEKLFSGHETLYTIDDVPKKKSEYSAAISELLDEEMFKILTDPFCFSDKIKWDVRREILFDLSENLDGNFFTENNEQKEKLKFQKKKLNDSIKSIPDRIDELSRAIVVVDVETLEAESRVHSWSMRPREPVDRIPARPRRSRPPVVV